MKRPGASPQGQNSVWHAPALLPVLDETARLRLQHNMRSAMAFVGEVRQCLLFTTQRIQTDNDSSFGSQLAWHLTGLGIAHRHVPPDSPEVNRKLEQSHRIERSPVSH